MDVVLTGRTEFWPDDRPFWLISPGCLVGRTIPPEVSLSRVLGIVSYPWTHDNVAAAQARLTERAEQLLEVLSDRLNVMHGVSHSLVYWRVLLGPWVHYYVNLLGHHEASLEIAARELGTFRTIGVDDATSTTPRGGLDFVYDAADDEYNLRLYSRLSRLAGIAVETRIPLATTRRSDMDNPENLPRHRASFAKRAAARFRRDAWGSSQRLLGGRVEILLRGSYFPRAFEEKLAVASLGRIWSHLGNEFVPRRGLENSEQLRRTLRELPMGGELLDAYLSRFVADDLPQVFVERYAELVKFADCEYGRYAPDVLLSTIAWHTDHAFCHFAGCQAERGARVVGGQHGGNFGVIANFGHEKMERALTETYLTWGWSDPSDPRCIPTPANRLVASKPRQWPNDAEGILCVGCMIWPYPLSACPDSSGYPAVRQSFFEALPPWLRCKMRLRLHSWEPSETFDELRRTFPEFKIESWDVPFNESLRRARLYVCDNLSTTYTEALATNTPMVMFWDQTHIAIRPFAQGVFDQAARAGIVHYTPQSAAEWIATVYPDIEGWWLRDETQQAVRTFRHTFARTSEAPLREWLELLRRLARPASSGPRVAA